MDIYEKIDSQLKRMGKTRQQMCDEAGVNYGTLNSSYSRRSNKIQHDVLVDISGYLGVSIDYLLGGKSRGACLTDPVDLAHFRYFTKLNDAGKAKATEYIKDILNSYMKTPANPPTAARLATRKRKRLLPLYDYPASAGVGTYAGEGSFDLYEAPNAVPERVDFGVIISGDSMEPDIPDGSIVWVRQQPDVSDGQICIVVINDEGYCKVKQKQAFRSLNPKYKDISPAECDDVRISGLVTYIQTPEEQ